MTTREAPLVKAVAVGIETEALDEVAGLMTSVEIRLLFGMMVVMGTVLVLVLELELALALALVLTYKREGSNVQPPMIPVNTSNRPTYLAGGNASHVQSSRHAHDGRALRVCEHPTRGCSSGQKAVAATGSCGDYDGL